MIEHVALDASIPQHGKSEFIWIEVLNPVDSDFAVLRERFGLNGLAVEDAMGPTEIPKVDQYDDQIFVVLKVTRLENDAIKYDRRVRKRASPIFGTCTITSCASM